MRQPISKQNTQSTGVASGLPNRNSMMGKEVPQGAVAQRSESTLKGADSEANATSTMSLK